MLTRLTFAALLLMPAAALAQAQKPNDAQIAHIAFMPRRQVLDFKYARPAVDLWAITACLYWMITGHPPRDFPPGVNPVTIVLRQPPIPIRDRLSTVPAALAEVIDAVLGDTIEPTATQLAAALAGAT